MGVVIGFIVVWIVWQLYPIDQFHSKGDVSNGGSDSDLTRPVVQPSFDIDSWKSLLQTTDESLTINDYVDLLEDKSINQLVDIAIRTFELEQNKQIQLFQDLLISTLTHKSPETTLDLIWKFPRKRQQKLINNFVSVRAIGDLEHTVDIVQRLPYTYQTDALRTLLASHPDVSESEWKGFTEDAYTSKLIVRLLREVEAIAKMNQPTLAWDQLLQDDVANDEQKELLVQIAAARIEAEGFAVLSQFYDSLYPNDRFVLEDIMRELLEAEPTTAFQTVKNMSYEMRNFVLPILMEAWAVHSPKEAYFALTEIGDYKLQGIYRSSLKEWAKLDPLSVLDSVIEIERVDRITAVLAAISELAKTNPDEVIQRLEQLKNLPGVSKDMLAWELVRSWSEYDPVNTIAWIQEATFIGSHIQGDLLFWALRNYIQIDSDKAMELALEQPLDSSFVQRGLVGDLLTTVVLEGGLDKAINLLEDLPKAAIIDGFAAVGDELVREGRLTDALNLARRLEANDWENFLSAITLTATSVGVQNLIDELTGLPDSETRRFIASELLRRNSRRGDVLTEQQLRVVQALLPMEDQN